MRRFGNRDERRAGPGSFGVQTTSSSIAGHANRARLATIELARRESRGGAATAAAHSTASSTSAAMRPRACAARSTAAAGQLDRPMRASPFRRSPTWSRRSDAGHALHSVSSCDTTAVSVNRSSTSVESHIRAASKRSERIRIVDSALDERIPTAIARATRLRLFAARSAATSRGSRSAPRLRAGAAPAASRGAAVSSACCVTIRSPRGSPRCCSTSASTRYAATESGAAAICANSSASFTRSLARTHAVGLGDDLDRRRRRRVLVVAAPARRRSTSRSSRPAASRPAARATADRRSSRR